MKHDESSSETPSSLSFGRLRVTFLEPGLAIFEGHSPLEFDDLVQAVDTLNAHRAQQGAIFILADMLDVKEFPRHIRLGGKRVVAEHDAVAIVTTNFALRVVLDMMIRAVNLLSGSGPVHPHAFFDDSETALVWLKENHAAWSSVRSR